MSHRKTFWGFVVKPSWQSVGNLRNERNAGPFYVNANNALTNARWNIGGRQSDWQHSVPHHDYRPRVGARGGNGPLN